MIVEMSRVILLGPKRLLGEVTDAIQRLGLMHVDRVEAEEVPQLRPVEPGSEGEALQRRLEALLARTKGLLELLPRVGPVEIPTLEDRSLGELEALLEPVEREARELVRQRREAEEELELVRSYEGAVRVLSPLLAALRGSRHFETYGFVLRGKAMPAVTALQRELERITGGRVEVVARQIDEKNIGVVVAFHRRDGEAVRSLLQRAGITELRLPARFADRPASEALQEMARMREELPRVVSDCQRRLEALSRSARGTVQAVEARLRDELAKLEVLPTFAQSRYAFVVHGWVPTREIPRLRAALRQRFGDHVVVVDSPVDPHDHEEAAHVPVALENAPPVRPFQLLLSIFRPPRYGTWDPSPLLAVTFPLFVGLVIGDVGYGALFFALGWWMRNRARQGQPLEVNLLNLRVAPDTLQAVSWIVRVIAFWVMVFGALYAEVFGNLPELLFRVHPLFDRVRAQRDLYFQLIVLLGMGMIYGGLLGHLAQAVRHRNLRGIFESAVMVLTLTWVLLLLGGLSGLLPAAVVPVSWSFLWAALAVFGLGLAFRAANPMWFLESATAFGHVLSHARLMAFGLAAAALATAANELGPSMAETFGLSGLVGTVVASLISALAQVLFFVFTIVGHVIQPARLHWVEFFTKVKYHEETGQPYRPFQRTGR
ncbi:MAG: V-type ATPase 116kDa subunit family protein [Armatimonadota bacterium]|nr:V-type ATPase 116kDa subunit family protein [Armatimonadota bacterium]MDR7603278.1 V-type ATPase 116kDa subunit family protein [Armatimonadota bacterium]